MCSSDLSALSAHWQDTLALLQPADVRFLAAAIWRIESAPPGSQDAAAAAADLTALLVTRLPHGHPVRAAIAAQTRLAGETADWPRISLMLRALPEINAQLPSLLPAHPAPDDAGAEARLLAVPALTPEQVREHGADPDDEDLIRLSPGRGLIQLPSFQFGPDGQAIPIVKAINRLLVAAEDPWGVADWWLGSNTWLNATPADLIGQVEDTLLALAAQAEFPEA